MTSFTLTGFPETPDVSDQVDYPDDFEEDDEKEDGDNEAGVVPAASLQQPHDDGLEEFQLCDAGGLAITLKALKEKG